MADDAPPSSDRRRATRRIACFPSFVERSDAQKVTAMIADLAETGTRLLMQNPDLKLGDELGLELHILIDNDAVRGVSGRVVRVEPLPDARASLWTHEIGVEFHETLPLSTEEVAALEKREAPFGKRT